MDTLRRRPVAAAGLILAVLWVAIVAWQTLTDRGFGGGGWYSDLSTILSTSTLGIAAVAGLVWLVEQSRILER